MEKVLMKDIMQWDIKSWSRALSYWENNVDWDNIQNGLELGGEKGGLSLWLTLKGMKIVCSDLYNIKEKSKKLHGQYNICSIVQYQDIDATNIPYENHFDIIIFKSILGGIGRDDNIEQQQKVLDEIYKALKPGGKLLFAENLKASHFHQRMRKKYLNWGNYWRYVSQTEMNGFLKAYSTYDMHTTGILGSFGRTENQRKFLSTIDQVVLNRVCPNKWNYIAYGIAEK